MLSCENYDYIEIACMHRYPLELTFKAGSTLNGIAIDTARNEDKQECMVFQIEGAKQLVVLDELAQIKATQENPHFDIVRFSDQ